MKLNAKQTDQFVSIVNNLIATYCGKYPEEYDFETASIGYDPDTLKIFSVNGDDLEDTLAWVCNEVVPDILS